MVTRLIMNISALWVCAACYCVPALAQTVSVLNGLGERGFGYMFEEGGICYAAMPRHVAGTFPHVTLSTAAPVVTGTGIVQDPFWPGIDLVVVVVREGLAERCTGTLDDFRPSPSARTAAEAQLMRLDPAGGEDRATVQIVDRDYLSLTGRLTGPDADIAQGTSGAFAFAQGEPIGMAIQSDDPGRAYFMRSEEIALNIGRFMTERSGGFVDAPVPGAVASAAGPGLSLVLFSSSAAPVNPAFAPENMLGDGMFVFDPTTSAVLDFRFEPEGTRPIGRVRITSPTDQGYALPKSILVQIAPNADSGRYLPLYRGQMGPDGLFDTGPMSARNAQRLRLIVLDAWSDGPIAIDTVRAD